MPHPPTTHPSGIRRSTLHPHFHVPENVHERPIKDVPQPVAHRPTDAELYVKTDHGTAKPNPDYLKGHFFQEGRLTESQALFILQQATDILSREPNLVEVKSPVTICGDIHGQYYDLMKLFEVGGSLQNNNYLFLGDYVDRGSFGIECLLFLYSLKICYPDQVTLLRGNHECRHLTEYFTFKRECLHKYSEHVYDACITSFCALPITALVDGRFFCVHGGLSPELLTLEDLRQLNRFQEPGSHGLLCDLLWSDPIATYGHEQDPSVHGPGLPIGTTFLHNATRGCSYFFTYEASCQFLERNHLLGIIRGHEAQDAGYTMHRKTPTKKFPSVITIFSAPNYLDVYRNRGAVLKYANKNITIRQFNCSSHPYWLPNFIDAFTWSLPFVGAKIADMLLALLSVCSEEELSESSAAESEVSEDDLRRRREEIKQKIRAVGKMQRIYQILREESENATELAINTPTPGSDALSVSGTQIGRTIRTFDDARRSDLQNERLPEFNADVPPTMFVGPSMRRGHGEGEGMTMEYLIKKSLEEDEDVEGGVVERISDKLAKGGMPLSRPSALKRHGTS